MRALTGLDKEVKAYMEFLQDRYNCVIVVCTDDVDMYISVLNIADGSIDDKVKICAASKTRERFMLEVRNWFKQNR